MVEVGRWVGVGVNFPSRGKSTGFPWKDLAMDRSCPGLKTDFDGHRQGLITDFDGHHPRLITVSGLDYDGHYLGLITDFDGHRPGLITYYDGITQD
jgi:hypothetical protein